MHVWKVYGHFNPLRSSLSQRESCGEKVTAHRILLLNYQNF